MREAELAREINMRHIGRVSPVEQLGKRLKAVVGKSKRLIRCARSLKELRQTGTEEAKASLDSNCDIHELVRQLHVMTTTLPQHEVDSVLATASRLRMELKTDGSGDLIASLSRYGGIGQN